MKTPLRLFALIILSQLISSSCLRQPEASFYYKPLENPEAGEEIRFYNSSLDADYYNWDFGNGESSEDENPDTKYYQPGEYEIVLYAGTKYRTDSIIQNILVNPPTVLILKFKTSSGTVLSYGRVKLYNSEYDQKNGKIPLLTKNIDYSGIAEFKNLEVKKYYVHMQRDARNGEFAVMKSVGPRVRNDTTMYTLRARFYSNTKHADPHSSTTTK